MSMQHRLPGEEASPERWVLYCTECAKKMCVLKAIPAQEGRQTRTYACACGHSEILNVPIC